MCGVAQEDDYKNDPVYNKPWHVVVSLAKVSISHCRIRKQSVRLSLAFSHEPSFHLWPPPRFFHALDPL